MSAPRRLWERLPAVYRSGDAEAGFPLRGLLGLIAEQADELERSIEGYWDDLFIETCDEWVIPYIGDLVGNRLLSDRPASEGLARRLFADLAGPDLRPPPVARARADVAKTIHYRRRKGTLAMLEELARDVSGWPVHAVEFLAGLGWSQNANHARPEAVWARLREPGPLARLGGPFERASRSVDVRRISQNEGWWAPTKIGIFVWRLQSFPLERVPARRSQGSPWRFHFDPLGSPQPLFGRWRREGDEDGLADEAHLPAEVGARRLSEDLTAALAAEADPDWTGLYGAFAAVPGSAIEPNPDASFFIERNDLPVRPAALRCRRLDPWPDERPAGEVVAVDPASGRIALGDGLAGATRSLDVSFHYGFPAELGGGPYERRPWLVDPREGPRPVRLGVREAPPPGPDEPTVHGSLIDAIAEWRQSGRPDCVIEVLDSRSYELPASIELEPDRWLAIEAANLQRPLLRPDSGTLRIGTVGGGPAGSRAALTLGGVLVEGGIGSDSNAPRLRLLHCTLVPGLTLEEDGSAASDAPSLSIADAPGDGRPAGTEVEIAFSVCGPLRVSRHAKRIAVLDSIVDGLGGAAIAAPGGGASTDLVLQRCTVFGGLDAHRLEIDESIVCGPARAARTDEGCVRFSYLAPGSTTPRRYRSQPDLAIAAAVEEAERRDPELDPAVRDGIVERVEAEVVPQFTATGYGRPGYAQLRLSGPRSIRSGAADGGEIGAFNFIGQAQRESNLRIRLEEYLPVGLEAGWIYVT